MSNSYSYHTGTDLNTTGPVKGSLVSQLLKNLPAMQETQVLLLRDIRGEHYPYSLTHLGLPFPMDN